MEDLTNTNPSFDAQQIFWWAFKTSDDSAPNEGLANVLERGIFSSTLTNWVVPVEGSAMTSTVTASEEVNILFNAQRATDNNSQLKAAPEPSSAFALALLVMLVGTRRRRRS